MRPRGFGKPLHLIAGKPLVQHVVERCREATSLTEVIVATDDERIAEVAREFCPVEMTRPIIPAGRTGSRRWRRGWIVMPW